MLPDLGRPTPVPSRINGRRQGLALERRLIALPWPNRGYHSGLGWVLVHSMWRQWPCSRVRNRGTSAYVAHNLHWNDLGSAAFHGLIKNALALYGAPFA